MIQKTRLIKTITVQVPQPSAGLLSALPQKNIFIADVVRNDHTGYYELISSVGVKIIHSFEARDDEDAKLQSYKFLIENASKEILEFIFDVNTGDHKIDLDTLNSLAN